MGGEHFTLRMFGVNMMIPNETSCQYIFQLGWQQKHQKPLIYRDVWNHTLQAPSQTDDFQPSCSIVVEVLDGTSLGCVFMGT